MTPPLNVSPLIKTARWSLLLAGVVYGGSRQKTLSVQRAQERVVEEEIKAKYLAEQAEAAARGN